MFFISALSLSSFFISLKDLGMQNIQKALVVRLISVSLVLVLLTNAYNALLSSCSSKIYGCEALKRLDYVECFPAGYRKGVKIKKLVQILGLMDFLLWVINNNRLGYHWFPVGPHNHHLLAIAEAESQLLDVEYDKYVASSASGTVFFV